ncbi:hypothetical protein [Candidatus Solirubrobacter pratensis]|uniref:hypothetical protein n=1 Tax=Candidatus Solirubrobacter pratensis TaxID=1298857 RepID=UPI000409D846|nr:hypothetical protein [Candidatus Solirubrobacter pratensis]
MGEPGHEDYEAAERLVREAHARAEEAARAAADAIPPNGWAAPGDSEAADPFPDLALLLRLAESARGAVPPELTRQLADALRELLVAVRAILDHAIVRLEHQAPDEPRVEDIPIT